MEAGLMGFKIKETASKVELKAASALRAMFRKKWEAIVIDIGYEIRDMLEAKLLQTDVYESLTSGILRQEFGLSDVQIAKLPELFEELISVSYISEILNQKKIAYLAIHILDYDQIPYEKGSYYSNTNLVEWLKWLLFEGTDVAVSEYAVKTLKKPTRNSRTEFTIMIGPSDNFSYSVPPEFAGDINNNFLTKVVKQSEQEILKIIAKHINKIPTNVSS